jgi:hypothetical protein
VDPFAVIILGGTAGLALALYLLGRTYPGSGADVLDWKPTRSVETEMQNEIDEMESMLKVANRRRERRGQEPLDEDGFRAMIMAEQAEHTQKQDEAHLDEEFIQMVEVKNRKRRAKGLPELTVEEYRAQIEGEVGE